MTDELSAVLFLASLFLLGATSWLIEVGPREAWRELKERWHEYRRKRREVIEREKMEDWPPKRPHEDN